MRRCSTERILAALVLALAAPAGAQEWRGSATPGVTLHVPSERWRHSDTTSWRDQYEFMDHEDDAPPWFLDLLYSELGYRRDDETWLLHLERTSPFAYGENSLLDVDWRGLRIEGDAYRWRTDDLRATPVGTGDAGFPALPRLGSHWNDDSDPNDRFFVRRYGGGGEIRLRPEDFGVTGSPLSQLTLYGSQEARTGRHQDRFLLDAGEVGAGPDTALFRGRTRELDQTVTTVGARLVAEPLGLATGVLDFSWQQFREDAPTAVVADIGSDVLPPPSLAGSALFYVPDTNRYTGTLRLSRRIGEATVQGGAYASRVEQTGNKPPLENGVGLHDDVTTFSAHGAADVPITDWLGFDAYGKAAVRKNGLDPHTDYFADDNHTQLAPFLKQLVDVRSGAELSAQPVRGTHVGVGWRMQDVNRRLAYPHTVASDGIPQLAITPAVSLVGEDSSQQEAYVRAHARLLKRTRFAGEVGYSWATAIGSPMELQHAVYAEGRLSHGIAAPIPITIAAFGHYRNGDNGGWELESTFPDRSQEKNFRSCTGDWGLSITALPTRTTTLYLSLTQQLERQRFSHVRSNVPRFNGADFVRFYLDSRLGWNSDARILAIGATQQITRRIDVSIAGWTGFVSGRYDLGETTADALNDPNEIDLTYGSTEAAVGVQVLPALRVGLAYRYDAFKDDARLDEPKRDGHDHAVTLSATYDFELAGGK